VNNTHWVVISLSGTLTLSNGTSTQFTKTYGHKHGLVKRGTQTCKGSQTDASGNTFSFIATVARTTR
jgi:hypothetical protein